TLGGSRCRHHSSLAVRPGDYDECHTEIKPSSWHYDACHEIHLSFNPHPKQHEGNDMNDELIYSDATTLAEMIRDRKVSSVEVVQAHLDRIEATNDKINAIVTVNDDALEAAEEADEQLAAGAETGP